MRHSALVVIALGLASCSSDSGGTRAAGGDGGTGASGGSGGAGAGGGGGSSGSGGAAASGGTAGSGGGTPCVKLPSAFSTASKESCNGKDDDGDGATDDQQTGWKGFCDRSARVDPGSYTFLRTLAQYKTEFDKRWASAKAGELANATTCNPCDQEPYYLQGPLKALVTMYRATDDAAYLDDAVAIADAMIAAADPYDPAGAKPADASCFDAWAKTVPGGLHYWSTLGCTPTDASWRYQLNELQGLRGIAELAAVLSAKSDPREKKLFDYADQVLSFYAMLGATKDSQGKCQGNPQLDGAADKRSHFIISAIDLHRASGDSRFLDWATKVANTQLSTVIVDDGDFVKLYVTPGATEVNDASHANREAELIRTLFEAKFPDSEKRVRQFVNTLLFRIWESDPSALLDGKVEYPFLFRNFTDGSNGCFSATSPPYRTGSVTMGWDELGRYDARVLQLMEKLTIGMIENAVPTTLPAASGCSANGNTNYSFILAAIAEMAYAERRVSDQCGG